MPALFRPSVKAKPSGRCMCARTLFALQVFQPLHSFSCSARYSGVRNTREEYCAAAGRAMPADTATAANIVAKCLFMMGEPLFYRIHQRSATAWGFEGASDSRGSVVGQALLRGMHLPAARGHLEVPAAMTFLRAAVAFATQSRASNATGKTWFAIIA